MEEPPSKVSKFDMSAEYLDESLEDGQEEWLSDGILTDDEYPSEDINRTSNGQIRIKTETDETQVTKPTNYALPEDLDEFLIKKELNNKNDQIKVVQQIKGPKEEKLVKKEIEHDDDATDAGSSDGGNDTDDLLRMLGDDVKKKIENKDSHKKERIKKETPSMESSDEEFSLNNAKATRLKVLPKNVTKPMKAEPEDSDSYGDMSSDEDEVLKRMFNNGKSSSKPSAKNSYAANTNKPAILKTVTKSNKKQSQPINTLKPHLRSQGKLTTENVQISSPNVKPNLRSNSNTRSPQMKSSPRLNVPSPKSKVPSPKSKVPSPKSNVSSPKPYVPSPKVYVPSPKPNVPSPKPNILSPKPNVPNLKPNVPSPNNRPNIIKPSLNSKPGPKLKTTEAQKPPLISNTKQNAVQKPVQVKAYESNKKIDFDETIDEDDYNEEADDFDLDDELGLDSESDSTCKLRLMEPEKMDEEMPSDFDSSEDESYSEIPTSDSEDLDDWFTIDVRNEKAADYLPLLGSKAYQVLEREKERVGFRLLELKKSVQALSDSSKKQAEQVREATANLGEIEAMIKAT